MKLILSLIAILLTTSLLAQKSESRCGTTHYLEHQIKNDPTIVLKREILEKQTDNYIKNEFKNEQKAVVVIPVVVHVIYNTSAQNIPDAQIYSQIDVLNEDYRRLNADTNSTPAIFKSIAADCEIQFCLAVQDPNGNWTSGITRTQTTKSVFEMSNDEAKYTSLGGHNIWDRNKYLNIWVVPSIKDGIYTDILGYAQLPQGGSAATDGVVIQYSNFGRIGNLTPYYNKGRTVTHEVGHWLNLYHIWGDDGYSCSGSDLVDDTPNQADENYDCPSFPEQSCNNTSDMYSNYMDYTDDDCMNIFTNGQKARMWATINGFRASLKTSPGCVVNSIQKLLPQSINIQIFPNPASKEFRLTFDQKFSGTVEIFNSVGEQVATIESENNESLLISTNGFGNGLFFIRLKNEKSIITRKIQILN